MIDWILEKCHSNEYQFINVRQKNESTGYIFKKNETPGFAEIWNLLGSKEKNKI
jgi:hypothetical protein